MVQGHLADLPELTSNIPEVECFNKLVNSFSETIDFESVQDYFCDVTTDHHLQGESEAAGDLGMYLRVKAYQAYHDRLAAAKVTNEAQDHFISKETRSETQSGKAAEMTVSTHESSSGVD